MLDEHAAALDLSDNELHAIACYQSDAAVLTYGPTGYRWHELMNASLRNIHLAGVDARWSRRIAEQVDHLQAALAKSRLPARLTLWRGVSRGESIEAISAHLGAGGTISGKVVLEGFLSMIEVGSVEPGDPVTMVCEVVR